MILMQRERTTLAGERIVKIASSFSYVGEDAPVHGIIAELAEPYRDPVAVVDANERVLGIIEPKDLVETLGKPFGRDLLLRQSARDIMRPAASFPYDEYIASVRERITPEIGSEPEQRYVLTDTAGVFKGHVSAQDILVHALNDHQREHRIAAAIQNRLVPPYFAVHNRRLEMICAAVMAQGVGGDCYFSREYEKGKWFFCLCDISGKGISASVITALLAGFMHHAPFGDPLSDTVADLNRIILGNFRLEKYLTGFFAKFDEETGELEYCDMGHSWFFAVEDGAVHQVSQEADNVPVGLVAEPLIQTRTLRIAPGTALLLVSDGFIEQENRDGESFPIGDLAGTLSDALSRGENLLRAKVRILERFYSFKGSVPQHDDISLLLFHYKGDQPSLAPRSETVKAEAPLR